MSVYLGVLRDLAFFFFNSLLGQLQPVKFDLVVSDKSERAMTRAIFMVLIFLPACGTLTEDELWRQVERARAGENFDSTIQVCQTILKEYPEGRFAAAATFMIADAYNNGKKDYRSAVAYYRKFVREYPQLKQAPYAIFIAGFLYNNHLQMSDSARIFYTEFLQKYPTHELAQSAQFELETLGKTPDEALQQSSGKPEKSASRPRAKRSK